MRRAKEITCDLVKGSFPWARVDDLKRGKLNRAETRDNSMPAVLWNRDLSGS